MLVSEEPWSCLHSFMVKCAPKQTARPPTGVQRYNQSDHSDGRRPEAVLCWGVTCSSYLEK